MILKLQKFNLYNFNYSSYEINLVMSPKATILYAINSLILIMKSAILLFL